jgi:DNA processing protein
MDLSSVIIPQSDFKDSPLLMRLFELHDVPKQLYIRGTLPEVTLDEYGRATPRILTIVGSRKCTTYGKSVIKKLLSGLAGEDVVILSGLALGIDGTAHKEAIAQHLTTIAIPGSGLAKEVLYPSTHKALAEEILTQGGALISELEDAAPSAPWTFPMRNRVMAALSDAVLIIETEEKSGTLITARQALELGRDIGAVPGDIFSPTAQGTHLLIKDGAYPITSTDDLLALLHLPTKDSGESSQEKLLESLNEHESIIFTLLREPLQKDALFSETGLSPSDFLAACSTLEMRGYIEETFGEVRKVV